MKKVLAIAPYDYLPFYSGGQKFISRFLEYLGKETELTVISTKNNDWSLAHNYKGLSLLKKSFSRYYDISLVKKIELLVEKEKFDSLICEHPYQAWLAFRIRKKTGIRVIIHTHNIEYQRFRSNGRWWWPILKIYERWSFKKADSIFFITPEDRNFAVSQWNIEEKKCLMLPFGIDLSHYPDDKGICRDEICRKYNIDKEEKILLFTGLLSYKSNLDALLIILDKINPLLLKQSFFRYKIIVCGKGLPENLKELAAYADKNIIYTGFVNDVETYFKSADIFLNPIQSGGGVKTKLVEAIAYGTTVISSETGAIGIPIEICGDKLLIYDDKDWEGFAGAVINNATKRSETPQIYYDHFYWPSIIKRVISVVPDK